MWLLFMPQVFSNMTYKLNFHTNDGCVLLFFIWEPLCYVNQSF